jgi:hypothetical protein
MIGLDLGGTDLKAGRIGVDGSLTAFRRAPSRTQDGRDAPIATLVDGIRALAAGTPSLGVGLGCPGVISADGALVGRTPHLPHWSDLPLAALVRERSGLPVVADNDANCAALAEATIGAARGAAVVLMVTLAAPMAAPASWATCRSATGRCRAHVGCRTAWSRRRRAAGWHAAPGSGGWGRSTRPACLHSRPAATRAPARWSTGSPTGSVR